MPSELFVLTELQLPVLDADGFPIQAGGITAYPGLYFVGQPWLPTAKSGLLYGVGDSARYIATNIMARNRDLGEGLLRRAA